MGPQTIPGSQQLAVAIRERRKELQLTIEEAAVKAGVGIKTWCRYEAGESIRKDKYRGVCKALHWRAFPSETDQPPEERMCVAHYKTHEIWSQQLADLYGDSAAASFAIGSDILLDHIEDDLHALAGLPKGTHAGQLDCSYLADLLPRQFLMQFDYTFMYALYARLLHFREIARCGGDFTAHSVLDELTLYLVVEESHLLMDEVATEEDWDSWIFDLFGDEDIVTFLYSNWYLSPDNPYHFDHWQKSVFYCDD